MFIDKVYRPRMYLIVSAAKTLLLCDPKMAEITEAARSRCLRLALRAMKQTSTTIDVVNPIFNKAICWGWFTIGFTTLNMVATRLTENDSTLTVPILSEVTFGRIRLGE